MDEQKRRDYCPTLGFLPAGRDTTIIVEGTPCNVTIERSGITIEWWPDEQDSPSHTLFLSWDEVRPKAVPA